MWGFGRGRRQYPHLGRQDLVDLGLPQQKSRLVEFLRRIQLVTSVLHLLVLQERQQGTTLASSYRPPRDIARTQSFCSGVPIAPQYAQPPHATCSASHCELVRS